MGRGALVLVAGTLGIIVFEVLAVGSVVGLVGYQGLKQVGIQPYVGFLSAYFNTREVAPLVAANALVATVGAGFTAQLGAMRISEEIDAVEVMAIPSIPFLVSTRVIASFLAVIPLYFVGLIGTYAATQAVSIHYYGLTGGTYDHYFNLFLPPIDVLYSFAKVLVFSVILTLICCYYGFTAKGGPAGVGVAVGRAVRLSLVHHRDRRLLPQPRAVGLDDDRADRGLTSEPATAKPSPGLAYLAADRAAGLDQHLGLSTRSCPGRARRRSPCVTDHPGPRAQPAVGREVPGRTRRRGPPHRQHRRATATHRAVALDKGKLD